MGGGTSLLNHATGVVSEMPDYDTISGQCSNAERCLPLSYLTESEARYRDIAELVGDWLWETDANHRIVSVGGRMNVGTGYGEADFRGRTCWEIVGVEFGKDLLWAKHRADIEAHRPFQDFRFSARDRDGKILYLVSNGTPFFDRDGTFKGYRGATRDLTAETEMRRELERSRDSLVRAQKIGLIGSGEYDLVTGASSWSEETYAIMGLDPAGGPNLERFLSHVHPDDRAQVQAQRALNERGEAADPLEYRFVRPDGDLRWFLRKVEVVRDKQGVPVKLFTTHQDITERRRIEEELRRSQGHLQRAQSLGLIGSSEVNLRTNERIWSDEYFRLLGLDPATTEIGLTAFAGAILPEDQSKLISLDAILSHQGPIEPAELRVRRGDDKISWLRRQIEVTRDASGAPASILFTIQDITERKHTEDQLRRSREHLARVQNIAQIGSSEVNLSTREAVWSDMCYRLLNVDPATIEPSVEAALTSVHPDDREALREASLRGRRGEQVEPLEFRVIRNNGGVRWLVRHAQFVHDEKGRAISLIATYYDITDRKQTEAQLRQAQKMEAIGQLTGGIAHDFNNLLAVILGHLDLLAEDLADAPRLKASVQSCIGAVRRGASLTKSLLAFSRQQALEPIELDLNVALGDMEEMLRRALSETIEFQVIKGAELWITEADPGQLQNVLLNLVLNARDAMPKGGKVTIVTSNAQLDVDYVAGHGGLRPGDYVQLSVSDTGVGMSQAVVDRAFEPFFTTKESGKGSGLGLSMVYGFVRQTGGHVTIQSEPGHGTTVSIYLQRQNGKGRVRTQMPNGQETECPIGGRGTILVVEDNNDVREMTRIQLERLGYTVFDAMNAEAGLEVLSAHPETELLLTDVVLPGGMLGPELAERARGILPSLGVVFMSGYNEQKDELEKAGKGQPLRILQKPFHADLLAKQIRAALDDRRNLPASESGEGASPKRIEPI